jgi:hypothetical protein
VTVPQPPPAVTSPPVFLPRREVGRLRSFNLKGEGTVDDWDRRYRSLPQHPYYAGLDEFVCAGGTPEPVEIVVGLDGLLTFWEGHHRYSAMVLAGRAAIPVTGSGLRMLGVSHG